MELSSVFSQSSGKQLTSAFNTELMYRAHLSLLTELAGMELSAAFNQSPVFSHS